MKYFIKTFGCRVNFAESDELKQTLSKYLNFATSEKDASIIIVRACSVTHRAKQSVRQEIRKYKRNKKIIYVLGCFREKISEAKGYFKNDKELIRQIKKITKSRIKCKLIEKNQFIKIERAHL